MPAFDRLPSATTQPVESPALARIGIVAIGRNEGERLVQCLESARRTRCPIVYVDSGSADGSVEAGHRLGVHVVELDRGMPFSAARARNEGFERLRALAPTLTYVQFVDGDCEFVDGWVAAAEQFLDAHADVAAVCGRRKERFPERSVFNFLCNIEWDTPVGEAKAFGGDATIRVDALAAAGGYRASLIAGEDPELGVRLRAAGWRLWRLDRDMTLHDAQITRLGQWWRRSTRAGYAFAEVSRLHGAAPERFWVRESRSAAIWALWIPLASLVALLLINRWAAAALLLAYPLQLLRLFLHAEGSPRQKLWRAGFLILGKFPEMIGQAKFFGHRTFGGLSRLIEYK